MNQTVHNGSFGATSASRRARKKLKSRIQGTIVTPARCRLGRLRLTTCVSTRRSARGSLACRTCLRERFASPTSKPPTQLPPTFPFEWIRRVADRPNDSPPPPEVFAQVYCAPVFGQRPHTRRLRTQPATARESEVLCKSTPCGQSFRQRHLRAGGKNGTSTDTSPGEGW